MKKTLALLLALLISLSLCACGSAKTSAPSAPQMVSESAAYVNSAADYDYAAEDAAYGGFSAAAKGAETEAAHSDAPEVDPEKIIYSADVTVETTDFDESIAKVEALVKAQGGWIESSSVNGANFYDVSRGYSRSRSASYTLRIPSARFQELMGQLSALGNIPYSHTYTENVTAQYYDVQARLKAYEAQETRLLEMMELAETVEDVIALESRLSELRYQIESLQSTLNNWDRRVSYSGVYLELKEVKAYTPEPETRISYGEELLGALGDGVAAVGSFFRGLLLALAYMLPLLVVLVPLGILAVKLLRKLLRRCKARRKTRREAKRAKMTAPAIEDKGDSAE